MPHANIWIRKENEDKWNDIADKSAWVNSRLNNTKPVEKLSTSKPITKPTTLPAHMQPKSCKNGHPVPMDRDRCLGKGCKYA